MNVPTYLILLSSVIWSTSSAVIPATRLKFVADSLTDLLTSESHDRPKARRYHELTEVERTHGDRVWDDWSDAGGNWNGDQKGKRKRSKQNQGWSVERHLRLGDNEDEKEFRKKKLGRFEVEDGERFRQVADKGRARERKWFWDTADEEGDDKVNAKNKKPREVNRRRHRIHEYHQKRRKQFNNIHRGHHDVDDEHRDRDTGNRRRRGDYYRRIHHRIWGDSDEERPARRGKVRKKQTSHDNHRNRRRNEDHTEEEQTWKKKWS